ncbi:unnamed protein product [Brassica oleracea var. botrytis]
MTISGTIELSISLYFFVGLFLKIKIIFFFFWISTKIFGLSKMISGTAIPISSGKRWLMRDGSAETVDQFLFRRVVFLERLCLGSLSATLYQSVEFEEEDE